jgi:hypothetical protein
LATERQLIPEYISSYTILFPPPEIASAVLRTRTLTAFLFGRARVDLISRTARPRKMTFHATIGATGKLADLHGNPRRPLRTTPVSENIRVLLEAASQRLSDAMKEQGLDSPRTTRWTRRVGDSGGSCSAWSRRWRICSAVAVTRRSPWELGLAADRLQIAE